jgi:hypothetical protein
VEAFSGRLRDEVDLKVEEAGLSPRSPDLAKGEPNFDIAWQSGDSLRVVEVKTTIPANEELQLRLGLGQVLRYADALRSENRQLEGNVSCRSKAQGRALLIQLFSRAPL